MVVKQYKLYNLEAWVYDNPIIYYFNLFLTKDPLILSLFIKLLINIIGPPTSNPMILLSLYVLKNNLNFNNLGCQTFTYKLYNLNYIISTII